MIEAGASLNTLGCPVYYVTAQIDGAVDDPANLVEIVTGDCPEDVNNDGTVGIGDLLMLLAAGGPCWVHRPSCTATTAPVGTEHLREQAGMVCNRRQCTSKRDTETLISVQLQPVVPWQDSCETRGMSQGAKARTVGRRSRGHLDDQGNCPGRS